MGKFGIFEIVLILSIVFAKFAIVLIAFLVIRKRNEKKKRLYLEDEQRRKDAYHAVNTDGMT